MAFKLHLGLFGVESDGANAGVCGHLLVEGIVTCVAVFV